MLSLSRILSNPQWKKVLNSKTFKNINIFIKLKQTESYTNQTMQLDELLE